MLNHQEIDSLIGLRHHLHQNPESSGNEQNTAVIISDFISRYSPNSLKTGIGGHGVLATWHGTKDGSDILIRAELDALPIQEKNTLEYRSKKVGVSHKCGHDGHMSILCGLGILLNRIGIHSGSVSLLFQPAEETGKGALAVLNDPQFSNLEFDHCFSLHNIPGIDLGTVLSKQDTFCQASKGIKLKFKGATSHASQPHTGVNPSNSIVQLYHFISHSLERIEFTNDTLATITHINIGEPSLGISPGIGELWVTIRAFENHDLDLLERSIIEEAQRLAINEKLELEIKIDESFRATINHSKELDLVLKACESQSIPYSEMNKPNPWSEDFGLFLEKFGGAMFGLGSGKDCPDLHDPYYDFPDPLIERGTLLFWQVIQECIKKAT